MLVWYPVPINTCPRSRLAFVRARTTCLFELHCAAIVCCPASARRSLAFLSFFCDLFMRVVRAGVFFFTRILEPACWRFDWFDSVRKQKVDMFLPCIRRLLSPMIR